MWPSVPDQAKKKATVSLYLENRTVWWLDWEFVQQSYHVWILNLQIMSLILPQLLAPCLGLMHFSSPSFSCSWLSTILDYPWWKQEKALFWNHSKRCRANWPWTAPLTAPYLLAVFTKQSRAIGNHEEISSQTQGSALNTHLIHLT